MIVLAIPTALAQANSPQSPIDRAVVPRHYGVALDLDPALDTFSGRGRVTIDVIKTQATLRLDARGLDVSAAKLSRGPELRTLAIRLLEGQNALELRADDGADIATGEWTVHLEWRGRVATNAQGLYRVDQINGGKSFRMLATQMQPTFARSVFPCFDTPDLKARFDIEIRAPAGYEVVSNMPEVAVTPEATGWRSHRFATSPPMATYLVAFAVGNFDLLEETADGLPLRVLAASGRAKHGRYALNITKQLLPYYGGYFGVPYRLPKLDQLAVPAVRNGAMEDWGLISYSEDLLLSAEDGGMETRRRVFSTVAHEISHQWFGNLVTPQTWEDLWLNESFATWMAAKAGTVFNPTWHTTVHDRVPLDRAMLRDANAAARALLSGPVDERNVTSQFNVLTYTKGSAILAMLEAWLGPQTFQRGVAAYIGQRQFGAASASALWAEMSRQAGRDVASVADSWLRQPGFPVIHVDAHCAVGTTTVTLRQGRFSLEGAKSDQAWIVPLVIRADGVDHPFVLYGQVGEIVLPGCAALLQVNASGTAYHRTAYSPTSMTSLVGAMTRLPPEAQITLLSDVFALAQSGDMTLSTYYELAEAALAGPSPALLPVLNQVRVALAFIEASFRNSPAQEMVRERARSLLRRPLKRLGLQADDDVEAAALRGALIRDLSFYEDKEAIALASAAFDAGTAPLGDYTNGIVAAVGRHPNERQFAVLLQRLQQATTEDDRQRYANAVAASVSRRHVDAVLKLAMSGELPPNIAASLPGRVGLSGAHPDAAYEFVVANFGGLAALAGDLFGATNELLPSTARGFNERAAAERLLADQARLVPQGAPQAAQMAARIRLMDAFRVRELPCLLNVARPMQTPACASGR